MSKKYDLRLLEDNLTNSLNKFYEKNDDENRINLFLSIRELAFAILVTRTWKIKDFDFEEEAHEYSTYLFERLITKRFIPKYDDRFPWNNYISLNIQNTLYRNKSNDFSASDYVEEFSSVLSNVSSDKEETFSEYLCYNQNDNYIDNFKIRLIYDSLLMFYNENEIKRLYPIASEIIYNNRFNHRKSFDTKIPKDIYDFIIVLYSLSKRIITEERKKFTIDNLSSKLFKDALNNSIKSSLFLSTITKKASLNYAPFELFLSVDMESLIRLSMTCGGKTIHIPSQMELNSIIAVVSAAGDVILNGTNVKDALEKVKKDYDLVLVPRLDSVDFVNDIVNSFYVDSNSNDNIETTSIVDTLFQSINIFKSISDKLKDKDSNSFSNKELIDMYKTAIDSISNIMKTYSKEMIKCTTNG